MHPYRSRAELEEEPRAPKPFDQGSLDDLVVAGLLLVVGGLGIASGAVGARAFELSIGVFMVFLGACSLRARWEGPP